VKNKKRRRKGEVHILLGRELFLLFDESVRILWVLLEKSTKEVSHK